VLLIQLMEFRLNLSHFAWPGPKFSTASLEVLVIRKGPWNPAARTAKAAFFPTSRRDYNLNEYTRPGDEA
jgi:hypothetical protein